MKWCNLVTKMDRTCDICLSVFNDRSTKHDHKVSAHFGGLICDVCGHHVWRRNSLRIHYLKKHGIPKLNPNIDYIAMPISERKLLVEEALHRQELSLLASLDSIQEMPSDTPSSVLAIQTLEWLDEVLPLNPINPPIRLEDNVFHHILATEQQTSGAVDTHHSFVVDWGDFVRPAGCEDCNIVKITPVNTDFCVSDNETYKIRIVPLN